MKMIRILSAFLAIAFSTSCVPLASFYPLWDREHTRELPGLEDTWIGDEGGSFLIAKVENGAYEATFTDEKKSSRYELHVVALGGKYILDFFPQSEALEERLSEESYLCVVPAHFFARLTLEGDTLQLELLDDEKVESKIGANNPAVPLLKRDDQLFLTADTQAMQKLMIGFAEDPAVWDEKTIFKRKPATKP
jgi:hypothetical protein